VRHRIAGDAHVPAFVINSEKLHVDQRVEDSAAQERIHAAEPLHLRNRQTKSGHFQKLAAEAFECLLHGVLCDW
jgi:hypothetical protein